MQIGDRITWWPIGQSMPTEPGDYTIVGIWAASTSLQVVQTASDSWGDCLFLVRNGMRVGFGTHPSQGCALMYLAEATVDKIGCNDLRPGELAALQQLFNQCKHDLPLV